MATKKNDPKKKPARKGATPAKKNKAPKAAPETPKTTPEPQPVPVGGAPRDIWHNALVEANAHGRIDAIVAIALREYPNNPALRALGGA